MNLVVCHIIIPAIVPVLFFINAALPVEVLGCRTRGLVAVILALASAVAALVTTLIGAKLRVQGNKKYTWWLLTTAILVVSPIALLILV